MCCYGHDDGFQNHGEDSTMTKTAVVRKRSMLEMFLFCCRFRLKLRNMSTDSVVVPLKTVLVRCCSLKFHFIYSYMSKN